MRIISGFLKGKSINYLRNSMTRPLKDSVKENIFNILHHSNLINVKIALYAPPTFLSSGAFKPFREKFLSVFQFNTGILFSANHFADVSKNWGISFTVWESSLNPVNPENFTLNLKDQKDGEIIDCGLKTIYNTDNKISGSIWTKGDFQKKYGRQVIDFPQLSRCSFC